MDRDITHAEGRCHCGAVRFRVKLIEGLHSARRCNCSYCRMRGAVAVTARLDGLNILAGEDLLTVYQFHSRSARHYFCSKCGVYTHHRLRSKPNQYGVNVACLNGVSPFDFAAVPVVDGANHPADAGRSEEIGLFGTLWFVSATESAPQD